MEVRQFVDQDELSHILSQLPEGLPVNMTDEEMDDAQFEHVCAEVERVLDEQREEWRAVKWMPIGLAIGFSGLLTVLAACGCIDKQVACAGYVADGLIAAHILQKRDTFRKLNLPEWILDHQEEIRDYLRRHPGNLSVRVRAEMAGVRYAEISAE